jgi:hypothetical protein
MTEYTEEDEAHESGVEHAKQTARQMIIDHLFQFADDHREYDPKGDAIHHESERAPGVGHRARTRQAGGVGRGGGLIMTAAMNEDLVQTVLKLIADAGNYGMTKDELVHATGADPKAIDKILKRLRSGRGFQWPTRMH